MAQTRIDRASHGSDVAAADVPLAPIDRRIFVVAGGLFTILMALSARYGFHRDELYFLDCGRHLAASYVDQPIFSPLMARLSLDLFGLSLTGLRLWPSLAAAGTVILGGLLAREFGGGAWPNSSARWAWPRLQPFWGPTTSSIQRHSISSPGRRWRGRSC